MFRRRPTLCWPTQGTVIILAAALSFANLAGELGDDGSAWVVWAHGWPFVYMRRDCMIDSGRHLPLVTSSRFPVDAAPVHWFSAIRLVINLSCALIVVAGCARFVQRLCSANGNRPRFSVALCLAVIAGVATGLAWFRANSGWYGLLHDDETPVDHFAYGLVFWATCLAWYEFLSLITCCCAGPAKIEP